MIIENARMIEIFDEIKKIAQRFNNTKHLYDSKLLPANKWY